MAIKDGQKKGVASLALLEVGLLELGFVALVIGLILFVLNYFNVISLNQLYPNQLGWLPQQERSQNELGQTNQMAQLPQISCPIKSIVCGEQLIQNGKYVGLGFQLATDSEIYAAIPGTAIFKIENVEGAANHIIIAGTGEAQGYEAVYDFFGSPVSSTSAVVTRGGLLGEAEQGSFLEGRKINLILNLKSSTGANIELKPSDFQP